MTNTENHVTQIIVRENFDRESQYPITLDFTIDSKEDDLLYRMLAILIEKDQKGSLEFSIADRWLTGGFHDYEINFANLDEINPLLKLLEGRDLIKYQALNNQASKEEVNLKEETSLFTIKEEIKTFLHSKEISP